MNLIKKGYADPAHDAVISSLEKELTGHSEIQGRQNGLHNKPVSEDELRAYQMNFVESKIQAALDHNQQEHLPVSGMVVAQKVQADAKQKINVLNASVEEDEHKLHPLEEQKKRLAPDLQKRNIRRWVYAGVAVISIAEGYFAYEALRQASLPRIAAFFAALGIAAAVGFGTHILAGYIRKAKTRIQRIFRYSIVLIPAFIGFYVLGHLRADAYNNVANLNHAIGGGTVSSTGGVSGWGITIISYLLFIAALLFSIKFHKTEEEAKYDQEYDRVCKEIRKLLNKMKATKDNIAAIQREAILKAQEALTRYEYALATENRLKAIARHSMEVYKDSNLRHRTDGLCPIFFSHPPAFSFKLFFDNVKNDNVKNA